MRVRVHARAHAAADDDDRLSAPPIWLLQRQLLAERTYLGPGLRARFHGTLRPGPP
jgi:hypothetical protein